MDNKIRAAFIYYKQNKLIGIAIFDLGICMKFLFNKDLLKSYMTVADHIIYDVPEYLDEVVAGCDEGLWNNMFAKESMDFLTFTRTKEYDLDQFKKIVDPMIPFIQEQQKHLE